jgi:hypothetical protein
VDSISDPDPQQCLHGRRGQGRDAEAATVSARLLGGLLQAGVGARSLLPTVEAGHLQPAVPVDGLAQLIKKKKPISSGDPGTGKRE